MSHQGTGCAGGRWQLGFRTSVPQGPEEPQTQVPGEAYGRQGLLEEKKVVWFSVVWADVTQQSCPPRVEWPKAGC